MKKTTATIAEVEAALVTFIAAAEKDKDLEKESGKKLAAAVEALTPKDDVTKELNQAYTNAEKWWAVNVLNDEKEGCTRDNKKDKIRSRVLQSDAWTRHIGNPDTKGKADQWLAKKLEDEEDKAA